MNNLEKKLKEILSHLDNEFDDFKYVITEINFKNSEEQDGKILKVQWRKLFKVKK